MNTAIYFKLSDGGEFKRFNTKNNRVIVEALGILKKVLSFIHTTDFSISKIGPGHMRGLAFATFKFETENVQVGLISTTNLEEAKESNAFQLFFWSSVPFWKSILGYKPEHPENIDKTISILKPILLEQLHATDVRVLTDAEARLLKKFH